VDSLATVSENQGAGRRRRESNHRTSVERRNNSLRCGGNWKIPERNRGRGAKRRDTGREKY